jgi:hypothetical protein
MAGQTLGINEESFVVDLKNLKVYKRCKTSFQMNSIQQSDCKSTCPPCRALFYTLRLGEMLATCIALTTDDPSCV